MLSYEALENEVKNLRETLQFLDDKCTRQGRFIAESADFLLQFGSGESHVENEIYQRHVNFMQKEVEILNQRINSYNQCKG